MNFHLLYRQSGIFTLEARYEMLDTHSFLALVLGALKCEGPMKFSQLFYRLVSAGHLQNNVREYRLAQDTVATLCEAGLIPSHMIVTNPPFTIDAQNGMPASDEVTRRKNCLCNEMRRSK
jgi:hypothetical protein